MEYGHLFIILGLAGWAYMSAWFLLGAYLKRDDVVDSAWGLGFIFVALLSIFIEENFALVQILSVVFVAIWGLRLFLHLSVRNSQKREDRRYTEMKARWKGSLLLQTYFRVYILQGILLLLVSAPVIAILSTNEKFNLALVIAGFTLWGFGIVYEAIADYQLQKFVKSKKPGQIIQSGLWRYSRHPNYFGEITVWTGVGLVALAAGRWWGLIGPITITALLFKVSIPMLEKHYKDNQEYQAYKRKTSMLVPLPLKN